MADEPLDAAYLNVATPSYTFAETSPKVDEGFRGLRIAAPRRVLAGDAMRIPVCAVARFAEEPLPRPLWDAVAAIVVEVSTNRCWVGSLMDPNLVPESRPTGNEPAAAKEEPDPDAPPPLPPSPDDDLEEVDVGGVANQPANVDLRELLELPETPGSYEISLTWGPWASNAVRVVVELPKDGE